MALFNYATLYVGLQNANSGDKIEEDPALVFLREFAVHTVQECFTELVTHTTLFLTEYVQGLLFKRDYQTLPVIFYQLLLPILCSVLCIIN